MHTVGSSGDVRITVHELGGEGPAILFAHATGFHGLVWQPLARRLSDFGCWSFDFRAHGTSTTPTDGDLSWEGTADDVLAVIADLGLIAPFGVGHSMGGAALLRAEQRRPGTFSGMWVFEPIVFPIAMAEGLGAANPLSEQALRRRDVFASKPAAVENYASKPPLCELDDEVLDLYVSHGFEEAGDGTVRLRCRPEDESQLYRMGAAHDTFAGLAQVACGVVVARGRVDGFGPAGFAARIASELPHGELVEFAGLGHFGPLEGLDEVAESVRDAAHRAQA